MSVTKIFVDEAMILCVAGRGGKGCHSFDRNHIYKHPRPNGGDGGHGGSILLRADVQIQTLLDFQFNRQFVGENGGNGSSNDKRGRNGQTRVVRVPVGTEVYDHKNEELLKDLNVVGAEVVVCRGGRGGHGNHKRQDATEGEAGEEKEISLKLKLIADIGIIGFPNAGKSTLISRLTHARSRIADFPFTTKNPILGVVKFEDGQTQVLADIPGIIEGAHEGRGLGLEFLKHVERTRVLLHMVDMAAVDGRDPVSDYKVINHELKSYSPVLGEKDQILVANKMDVTEARENLKLFRRRVRKQVFPISAVTGDGLEQLLNKMREYSKP